MRKDSYHYFNSIFMYENNTWKRKDIRMRKNQTTIILIMNEYISTLTSINIYILKLISQLSKIDEYMINKNQL